MAAYIRRSKSERICLCREWEPFALGNGSWIQVAAGRFQRPVAAHCGYVPQENTSNVSYGRHAFAVD